MKAVFPRYEIYYKDKINGEKVLENLELVARTCYKSEDYITESSKYNLIRNLIKNGHEAMLEHESITVKFICDRGISHELVRHRVASFAQESTRYCNYSKNKFNNEVTFISILGGIYYDKTIQKKLKDHEMTAENIYNILCEWQSACLDAEKHYMNLLKLGASPDIARSVLNNSTKTEIVVTANLREWRHFFILRTDISAHPQMRELTIGLLKDMNNLIPIIFEDLV